jgi:hypothetical protein
MTSLARSLWEAVEPFHAATYFAPEPADAAKGAGLRGWWMGYFAARFAPLGPIGSEPVAAMAFGFAPAMVRRALPDAWSYASPADVLAGRLASTGAALRRIGGDVDVDVARLTHLLEVAGRGARFDGRPLGPRGRRSPRPTSRWPGSGSPARCSGSTGATATCSPRWNGA